MKTTGKKLHELALTKEQSLKTLVENRTVHTLDNCELNIFETYQKSNLVPLKFNDLVITSMLRGKKVMHLFDDPEFVYLPGETVIIPSNVEMKIDFPEATENNPTQCIALAIDHHKIQDTLSILNEKYPRKETGLNWELNNHDYFFYNNFEMADSINKLMDICTSSHITKDVLADLSLQELLIHVIQSQTMNALNNSSSQLENTALQQIVSFIRERLSDRLTLDQLTNMACMSKTSFYRFFKRELGISPIEFIMNERLKVAKSLLKDSSLQINEVAYASGFDDSNYFNRVFKKMEGITPKQYQQLLTAARLKISTD